MTQCVYTLWLHITLHTRTHTARRRAALERANILKTSRSRAETFAYMYTWYRRVRRNGRITKGFSLRGRAVKAGAGVWKESRKEFDVAVDGGSAITAVLPGHSLPFCLTCIRGSYTIDYFHRLFFFSRSLFLRRSFTAVVREDSRGDWGGVLSLGSRGGRLGSMRIDSIRSRFLLNYTRWKMVFGI